MSNLFKTLVVAASMFVSTVSSAFTVDVGQSPGPVSGHWWNPTQPGWGMAVQQQYETLFVQLYTYDEDGDPIWYVASCKVEDGHLCSSKLYTGEGGLPLPYYKEATVVPSGMMTLTFLSNSTAAFSFKIGDGVAWSTGIEKMIFDNSKP